MARSTNSPSVFRKVADFIRSHSTFFGTMAGIVIGVASLVAAYVQNEDARRQHVADLIRDAKEQLGPPPLPCPNSRASKEQSGKINKALLDLQSALSLDSNNEEALKLKGVSLHLLGRTEDAAQSYAAALVLAQKSNNRTEQAILLTNSAEILMRSCRFADALPKLEEAVKLDPRQLAAHCDLSMVHTKLGHPKEACASALVAVKLDKDSSDAHLAYGRALAALKDSRAVDVLWVAARQNNAPNAESSIELARALLPDRSDEALDAAKRAVEVDGDSAAAHACLAECLRAKGDVDGAAKERKMAENLRSAFPQPCG